MPGTLLSIEAAKAANIQVVEDDRYNQAVHDVVVALRAGRRRGTACTKTKGEVAGSGAKPWRQKGTGRARAGHKRSPIWRGGGVVFGPKPRDYSKRVSKKLKKVALRKALSERIKDGVVYVVDSFAVAEPKTKQFLGLLSSICEVDRTLIVAPLFDKNTLLAARNVAKTLLFPACQVNAEHLLKYRRIILTQDALPILAERMELK
jgi:large subunit ribosomal protein L4